jgi:hypothetical protein
MVVLIILHCFVDYAFMRFLTLEVNERAKIKRLKRAEMRMTNIMSMLLKKCLENFETA